MKRVWRAIAYKGNEFSGSKLFRFVGHCQIVWILTYLTLKLDAVTYEYVALALALLAVQLGDYRLIDVLTVLKTGNAQVAVKKEIMQRPSAPVPYEEVRRSDGAWAKAEDIPPSASEHTNQRPSA